jgi:hypothetical protein
MLAFKQTTGLCVLFFPGPCIFFFLPFVSIEFFFFSLRLLLSFLLFSTLVRYTTLRLCAMYFVLCFLFYVLSVPDVVLFFFNYEE